MNSVLRDMYGHQAWADAALWNAIDGNDRARADSVIHNRLHHIHLVQRAFMWAVSDRSGEFVISKAEEFGFADLKSFARESHTAIDRFLTQASNSRFEETINMPWFKDPPLNLTVSEALTQCAMHSHWHRGQNAARLRELGGEPPPLDMILWIWKGRPAPSW
jgi:uncharacterized damage-inducible protein DinB